MAAYEYVFKGMYKVPAQTVGEVLEGLERNGGLTPKTLLDSQRDENAPLHNEFEWDDTIAAEKWRLDQAQRMIQSIRIVQTDDTEERKAYRERSFVSTPGGRNVYVSMDTAMHKEEYRNHLLEQAKRDSEVYLAKYRRMEELAAVVTAMEDFLRT